MWLCHCSRTPTARQELVLYCTDPDLADPCSPWHRSRRLSSSQASPPTRRCPRRLHLLRRLNKNSRKYAEGYIRCCWEYIRFLDTQSVEGDEAQPEPAGGVWRCVEGGKEILESEIFMALSAQVLHLAIACRSGMQKMIP